MDVFLISKTVALIVVLSLALFYDVTEHKIKNRITLPGALIGVALNGAEHGWVGVLAGLQGWILPVIMLGVLYYINVMGAGDIKLFAAIGGIMGVPFVMNSIVFSIYVGGGIALIILIRRRQLLQKIKKIYQYITVAFYLQRLPLYNCKGDTTGKFPFALAIIPGSLLEYSLSMLNIKGFY